VWWEVLLPLALVIVGCFAFVLISGAPYLPTLDKQIRAALQLADLKFGDTVIELGCGDGRVLLAAARHGLRAVGYELNPLLYALCWLRTRSWRRQGIVQLHFGNFWRQKWPPAEAVYVFLLPRLMDRLERKVRAEYPKGIKLLSFAFKFSGRRPVSELDGVFLYRF
jgi:SAM-dependent methyltransferase